MWEGYRFLRERGGWEAQNTVVRKGSGALAFPSSPISQKPIALPHKLSFFFPLLNHSLRPFLLLKLKQFPLSKCTYFLHFLKLNPWNGYHKAGPLAFRGCSKLGLFQELLAQFHYDVWNNKTSSIWIFKYFLTSSWSQLVWNVRITKCLTFQSH